MSVVWTDKRGEGGTASHRLVTDRKRRDDEGEPRRKDDRMKA